MLSPFKTGFNRQIPNFRRTEKTYKRRSGGARAFLNHLMQRPLCGIYQFQRQIKRHHQRRARVQSRHLGQSRRIRVFCEIQRDSRRGNDRGLGCVKAIAHQFLPPRITSFKINRNKSKIFRDTETKLDQSLLFPFLRGRLIHFKNTQPRHALRCSLGKGIQSRPRMTN